MKLEFACIQRKNTYSPRYKDNMKLKFAGVKRKEKYSPNHTTNDALLLNQTAGILKKMGHKIQFYDEEFIEKNKIEEKYIFSMAQGPKALNRLKEMEKEGRFVINSPTSALNSHRINMVNMLNEASLPFPKSFIIDNTNLTQDYFHIMNSKKVWLKRGDVHAEHREDVTLVYSMNELKTTLEEFSLRGIEQTIVQEHLAGDTVKFYGVLGTDFFHWYYLNGKDHVSFDENHLKNLAFQSAEVLGLNIFGGDVIISPEGTISVIDLNDWPSFAPVREEAVEHIGNLIHKKAINYVNKN
ncbi:MAG: hypothetical protein PVH88_07080 [Ignavibacteria bacterium]